MVKTFSMLTSNVIVIIMTFHEVSGRYAKLPQTTEFTIKSKYGDVFKSTNKRELTKYLDFDDFITINDNEYPGDQLAYIVDGTDKAIQSYDKEQNQQTKMHTLYDSSKLGHLVLSSKGHGNSMSYDESCIQSIITFDLKHLRQHYTIKTENLGQSLQIVKCRENENCGSDVTQPLERHSVCTQDYTIIKLIRLPVKEGIEVKNQELLSIKMPTGCKCSRT